MAKILLLNESKYEELSYMIKLRLDELHYSIIIPNETNNGGMSINKFIGSMLDQVDGMIVVFDEETNDHSLYFRNLIASAVGYFENMEDKFILPFAFKGAKVPDMLENYLVGMFHQDNLETAVEVICQTVSKIISRNKAKETKKQEEIKRIENNSTEYIDDALSLLSDRESRNRRYANTWNVIGYASLALGAIFGVFNFEHNNISPEMLWYQYFYICAKGLVIIVFLAACSRYAFNLGKAYMNESLKNADRIHAISFGRFYLKSYGEKATWNELKEVFQHWNLDKNSYFTDLKSSEFDPKIAEIITELAKSLSLKNNVDNK